MDLTIKGAREAKIEEYLTSTFKSSLKAANNDRDTKKERHVKDTLLHPKLDEFVKSETRTDTKVLVVSFYIFYMHFLFRSRKLSSQDLVDPEATPPALVFPGATHPRDPSTRMVVRVGRASLGASSSPRTPSTRGRRSTMTRVARRMPRRMMIRKVSLLCSALL